MIKWGIPYHHLYIPPMVVIAIKVHQTCLNQAILMFSPLMFHIPQIYIQKDTLLCRTTTAVLTEWQSHLGATGIADFMLTVAAFSTKREIFFGQKFGPGSLLGFRPLGSVIHSTPGNGYIDLVDFCYRGQKRSPANQRQVVSK